MRIKEVITKQSNLQAAIKKLEDQVERMATKKKAKADKDDVRAKKKK